MFANREQAAMLLALKLEPFKKEKLLVFAIPRGAVGMGKIIAESLNAPFDILVVRKIGAPRNPELAIGAVGPDGIAYWDQTLCKALGVNKGMKNGELRIKNQERKEREKQLRKGEVYPNMQDKTLLVVDDGVATGATVIAAAKFIATKQAKKIVLATPVIAKDTFVKVKRYFDEVVYLEVPQEFRAVGQFYKDFPQISDEEVKEMLKQ